ncbi:hypothetical protein ABZ540_35170 [Nocardia xishanensis]|uniref:hypothetical protein n=1 Tax=Nocardia xishanensis TaxID=238964 RepID=UPI0033C3415E
MPQNAIRLGQSRKACQIHISKSVDTGQPYAEWNRDDAGIDGLVIRSIREGIENANGVHDLLAEPDPHGLERTFAR